MAREAGEDITEHEVSRRLLHRLMSQTNRRMHVGFPEMLSYLLRKPTVYCSHDFVPLLVDRLFRQAIACVHSYVGYVFQENVKAEESSALRIPDKPQLTSADYMFRPKSLEQFPLYFFMAGCEAVRTLSSDSMDWESIPCNDGEHVLRQRSFDPAPLRSKQFPNKDLIDASGKTLHKYGYYVRLRLSKPWKVPVLYGYLPRAPDDSSSWYEKGCYGLFLMMLFRPHRRIEDLVATCFRHARVQGSGEAKWQLVHEEYTRWKEQEIDAVANEALRKQRFHDLYVCTVSFSFFMCGFYSFFIAFKLLNSEHMKIKS